MDIKDALNELAQMVKNEIILRLHSSVGINRRTGTNTLIGSNLESSIDVKAVSDNELVFQIAEHYQYVVTGWKRTHRFPGTYPQFIKNLIDWVRRKNVRLGNMTQNQIVHYLTKRMLMEGREIAPRPFINYDENGDASVILPFLDEFFEKWADSVFERIMDDVNKFFNKT